MRHPRLVIFSVAMGLIFSVTGVARGSENVWTGIVIANNVAKPEPTPSELMRIEDTLKELFGYNQFKLIGQAKKTLKKGDEDWMAASKYFALHVDSKGASDSGYLLNLQLFQEKKLLLETEAKLSKSSPLVIKGPQIGDGQLLLLLVVQ
ncbi:MAG: hypothetical protein M3O66_04435 [Verrucomicrobiota bacterium]|nr:hypothetical protein [Verrucomicrobiota bacterium]